MGNTAQILATAKAVAAKQDAANLVTAKVGTCVKVGTSAGSATASPSSKKRPTTRGAPRLRAKKPRPAATVDPPAADDNEDVLGATKLEVVFNEVGLP